MKQQTFAIAVGAAFLCAAVFAVAVAFRVGQDREMERVCERSLDSNFAEHQHQFDVYEAQIATLRDRLEIEATLPQSEYIKRVKEAPIVRNLIKAVLQQWEDETRLYDDQRRDNKARMELLKQSRERKTFFWFAVSIGLAVLGCLSILIGLVARNHPFESMLGSRGR